MLDFTAVRRPGRCAVRLGGVCDIDGMDNRFRKLPPRIEPRYETHDVSDPPPLPDVPQTIGLTPAGQVADLERLAIAIARQPGRTGPAPLVRDPAQHGRRRWVLVALFGALALGMVAVAVMNQTG
ncbi:hypothetical protein [Micromonospora sp. IBHARD004]|uniref:hypothetical protein n=1 Tax=Micromonospora sp. IBHARD004 TaxID=3457764 RepID=UPI00405A24B3